MATRQWGSEKLVNSTTSGKQVAPRVAALKGGGFVVVWEDDGEVFSGIRAQIFDTMGARVGSEIDIAVATGNHRVQPDVAGLADGSFYVTWTQLVGGANYILGGIYDASGGFVRSQPVVFAFGQDNDVAVAPYGAGAAVTWVRESGNPGASFQLALRVFDGAGTGTDVTEISSDYSVVDPAVATSGNSIALAWRVFNTGQILTRVYDGGGNPISSLLQAGIWSTYTETVSPAVAWLTGGRLVVGWCDENYYDPRASRVLLRSFAPYLNDTGPVHVPDMRPESATVQINATPFGGAAVLRLTALPTGGVVASWSVPDASGSTVRLQAFDAALNRVGGEYLVTQSGEGGAEPAIAALADGRVVVTWVGPGEDDGDDINVQVIDPRQGTVTGGAANDTLYGYDLASDEISGLGGNDTLYGLGGDDALVGGLGNDVLDGGRGADALFGGKGDDTFILDQAGDQVSESANQGTDTIQTGAFSVDLALFANVENATLTGTTALSAKGTAAANVLSGALNSAVNVLTGLAGNDTYVAGLGDSIVEAVGGGTDTVTSATLSLNLAQFANVENATLTGALALSATGNAGANVLDGAQNAAANILAGLAGNDVYWVGAGDTVQEAVGGGNDAVHSALISLDLAAYPNVEWLVLRGSLGLKATGNDAGNIIDGAFNSAANVLTGLGGNDTYVVGAGDTVVEAVGGGTDQVQAWAVGVDLTKFANVENAALTGALALNLTGTAGANVLTGNAGANVIIGNGGGDTFTGLGGLDTMTGGAGADMFRFLAPGDSVVGAGRDVIQGFKGPEGDRIDLAAIDANDLLAGDQGFAWRGTAAFTGARGELRYDVSGPDVIVEGTITGAAVAFEMRMAGVGVLGAGDFKL